MTIIVGHRYTRWEPGPSVAAMTAAARSALWVPLFGDLADPLVVARLAAAAGSAR
jgi:hypothetical protein